MSNLRLLDLFSGIGGFSYAAEYIVGGFTTVQFVEWEPFCQNILSRHWPGVPIHDDITTFNPEPYSADVVCGGFPCQDISTAGKQAGIKQGTRSGLFYELMRVVRLVRPQYVVLENVSAILANGLDTVLGELAEAGFDAEWACIPASAVGACHRRDRWWLVAYAQGRAWDALPSPEPRGDWAPSKQAGGLRSDAANPSHMLSHGGAGQQQGQPGRRAVPESGDGDRAATPAPMRQRLEGPDELGSSGAPWPSAIARLSPDWRSYLSEPILCRGDDGLSGRVDRLKALGNAVVPQVAAIPLARVLELVANRLEGQS